VIHATADAGAIGPPDPTLRQLHVHYVSGRYEHIVRLGESVLDQHGSPRRRGRIHYYTAMAYFQLGRPKEGARLLDEARKYAVEAGEPRLLVECMAADVALAIRQQAPDAVKAATNALAACRRLSPVPKPLEARLLTNLSGTYLIAGEWSRALEASRQALQRMTGTFELVRQAILFDCIALAHRELGQTELAIENVHRAIELHELMHNTMALAGSENNLGLMLMDLGRHGEAREHFDRSLRLFERTGHEHGRADVLVSLGELSLAQGAVRQARKFARHGLEVANRCGEQCTAAQAHLLLGQVAEALEELDLADAEFNTARDLFARQGARGWLARAHRLHAEVLERRGRSRTGTSAAPVR
jgi:tetratricopeptide (TPR) repeat protein